MLPFFLTMSHLILHFSYFRRAARYLMLWYLSTVTFRHNFWVIWFLFFKVKRFFSHFPLDFFSLYFISCFISDVLFAWLLSSISLLRWMILYSFLGSHSDSLFAKLNWVGFQIFKKTQKFQALCLFLKIINPLIIKQQVSPSVNEDHLVEIIKSFFFTFFKNFYESRTRAFIWL